MRKGRATRPGYERGNVASGRAVRAGRDEWRRRPRGLKRELPRSDWGGDETVMTARGGIMQGNRWASRLIIEPMTSEPCRWRCNGKGKRKTGGNCHGSQRSGASRIKTSSSLPCSGAARKYVFRGLHSGDVAHVSAADEAQTPPRRVTPASYPDSGRAAGILWRCPWQRPIPVRARRY